jgi:hypothetical protein
VDDSLVRDEFQRIKLHEEIAKAQLIISQHTNGLAHYRQEVEGMRYEIGRLDERLGVGS